MTRFSLSHPKLLLSRCSWSHCRAMKPFPLLYSGSGKSLRHWVSPRASMTRVPPSANVIPGMTNWAHLSALPSISSPSKTTPSLCVSEIPLSKCDQTRTQYARLYKIWSTGPRHGATYSKSCLNSLRRRLIKSNKT